MSDKDAITAAVQAYIDGCANGDDTRLKEGFHPDARMFGRVGEDRYDVPIFPNMSEMVVGQPVGPYKQNIALIDVSGEAAVVKLEESGFWGQDFVDYFILNKIEGGWQIVGKSFHHVGPS